MLRALAVRLLVALALCAALAPAQAFDARGGLGARREVALAELPPEARATLQLIRQGGPFPYRKDGTMFHNREGRLPQQPRGYYREYTVPTPGSPDRGARRIVAGQGAGGNVRNSGEYWYTHDHYRSFRRIVE